MNNKIIFTFLKCSGNPEESILTNVSIVQIQERGIQVKKNYPIPKILHKKFYMNKFVKHLEGHLNNLLMDGGQLLLAMKSKDEFPRALALFLYRIQSTFKGKIDGVICGVEDV